MITATAVADHRDQNEARVRSRPKWSYCCSSSFRRFIGKGRHDLVREAAQALTRAAAAHDHVFDTGTPQGFELAHDLVRRADQAHRLRLLGRMMVGQDMRSAGAVGPARHRPNALLKLPQPLERSVLARAVVN